MLVSAPFYAQKIGGDSVGWWNDQYFFYGEDLDFCWQLKQFGFSLYFFPEAKAIHYQGISSGELLKNKNTQAPPEPPRSRSPKLPPKP